MDEPEKRCLRIIDKGTGQRYQGYAIMQMELQPRNGVTEPYRCIWPIARISCVYADDAEFARNAVACYNEY